MPPGTTWRITSPGQLSLFGVVVGIALLLAGIGLLVLARVAVRAWAAAPDGR